MKTAQTLFIGIPIAILLAACGSGANTATSSTSASTKSSAGTTSASGGGGAGTAAPLSCSVAPPSTVSSDLGVSGLSTPKQETSSTFAGCVYTNESTGTIVTLQMMNDSTAAKMAAEQKVMAKGESIKAYAGLGDQAFVGTLSEGSAGAGYNTLVARKGSIQIMVESSASPSAEKTLAEQVFMKIG